MNRYFIAITLALLVHIFVVLALNFSWQPPEINTFQVPQHVKATLVVIPKETKTPLQAKAQPTVNRVNKEAAKAAAAAKVDAEKKAKAKKEAERKAELAAEKKAKEIADAKAREIAKQLADKKKAEELEKEKARQELAKKQEVAKEAEQKRIEAENFKSAIEAQEGILLDSLDEEDNKFEAEAAQASQDESDASVYYQLIIRQISSNWSRPASARNGMTVDIEIHLLPNGELRDVFIIQGSGDKATDLSAERAVRKVLRFQVPQDIRLFESHFRRFKFRFKPEDLRQ